MTDVCLQEFMSIQFLYLCIMLPSSTVLYCVLSSFNCSNLIVEITLQSKADIDIFSKRQTGAALLLAELFQSHFYLKCGSK